MARKLFSQFLLGIIALSNFLLLPGARAVSPSVVSAQDKASYVGAVTCQSSMCHGGASPSRDQFTIWSHEDFHSHAYATLVTARSARMAESLGLASATESGRCTTCHAPFADFPSGQLASTATVTEGVTCENCHSGAANWLRSHTRPDWTYQDRIDAGLRDLRNAYVRADTCVKCHQVIDPELVAKGHPELIFELDGQAASEPRHWQEKADWFGPKAWLVGQAVALREMSIQLEDPKITSPDLVPEQQAMLWLLQQVPGVHADNIAANQPEATSAWSNQLAQTISGWNWQPAMSTDALTALAGTSGSFTDNSVPVPERELRAERLVLGLDRLFKSLHKEPPAPGQSELSALFAAVQDRDQFKPEQFSSLLQKFADVVAQKK